MNVKSKSMNSKEMDAACAAKCTYKGIGLLALRLAFLLMMLHGISKLQDIPGTSKFLGGLGVPVPDVMAWVVALAEALGGLLLALGLFTEYAGPVVAFDMLVAIVMVHLPMALKAGLPMGLLKLELPAIYMLGAIAIWLCGPGKYSLKRYLGWGCSKKC